MAITNLTLQQDADVIRRARIEAARRRAHELMADATKRGGRSWTRDELYDRWPG